MVDRCARCNKFCTLRDAIPTQAAVGSARLAEEERFQPDREASKSRPRILIP